MTGAGRVVYSALIGGYEALQPQPVARDSSVPFILFTDDPDVTSDEWDVRLVRPRFDRDAVRSARTLKIVGHDDLARFGESLWIDNRVTLTDDPSVILDDWLDGADVALFEHSARSQLIEEFAAVVEGGYDDVPRVWEQLVHYAQAVPAVLSEKPWWTGVIARRRTLQVEAAMLDWWAHVLRYSRRDQLSASVVVGATDLRVAVLPSASNHESAVHSWPPVHPGLGRRVATVPRTARRMRKPEIADPVAREQVESLRLGLGQSRR